jgi:DNA repair exonuclease SbcCD ATPase subunit
MRIKKIAISDYGCIVKRTVDFGDRVNLITGANGSGKTTLCSALIWGLWGQNVRGVANEKSAAKLLFEDSRILNRYVTAQGERVEFTGLAKINKTRFLETITPIFGDYAAWSRSLWITGTSVSAFSTGTPSARFQYMSKLIGAERFDKTLEKLREQLKEVKARIDTEKAASPDTGRITRDLAQLSRELAQLKVFARTAELPIKSAEQIREEIRSLKQRSVFLANEYRNVTEQLQSETTKQSSVCAACGAKHIKPTEEYERLHELSIALSGELSAISNNVRQSEHEAILAAEKQRNYATLSEMVETSTQRAMNKAYLLWADREEARLAAERIAELSERYNRIALLGKYVKRAKQEYLASAAAQISNIANDFLSSIGSEFAVSIKYADDALAVCLDRGPVDTYSKLSSGQRRRIDICLCLAMSELAASIGAVPKTAPLVIDEAFDTLDNSGVEALINLACEIANERQVFLVSHADPSAPLGPLVRRISL